LGGEQRPCAIRRLTLEVESAEHQAASIEAAQHFLL